MRRIINMSAIIGALALIGGITGWAQRRDGYVVIRGRVLTFEHRPIRGVAVYLDRGTNLIERYDSDSTGLFQLPLFPIDPHRATWLICVPGRMPVVGKPQLEHLGAAYYTYEPGANVDSTWRSYRASGWSGPIPRECPPSADSVGWRYPATSGNDWGAYTTTEPDWSRYPGPPALPR